MALAYVAGSFPSGLVIGKSLYHKDIRQYGSHNTGATNAYRVLGKTGGLCVLALDACKGALGVYLGELAGLSWLPQQLELCMIAGGLLAILGHSCSVFMKFKGGKRRDVSAYPDSDTQTHERGRSVYRSGGTADGREPDADTGSADAGRQ